VGNVSHIEFDPNRPGTVYATYSTFNSAPTDNHVYRSLDGGATWTGIDGTGNNGLPDIPVNTILVDPDDSTRLYLGTDVGLFASFDGGATWARDANPFADVMTRHLTIDRTGGRKDLYAFTYGRGVWRVSLNNTGTAANTCSYSLSPASVTADSTGGTVAVNVNTAPGCPWMLLPSTSSTAFTSPQPPASGVGSGTAFITVPPNKTTGQRTDSVTIQNQAVSITQPGGIIAAPGDESATARAINSLPFQDFTDTSTLSKNSTDPQHSCTGSTDQRTGWFRFTAAATGNVQVSVTAIPRNSPETSDGVVVTAYPLNGTSPGAELACAAAARIATTSPIPAVISFPVTQGSPYLIETSSPVNNAASDIASMSIGVTVLGAPATITLNPSSATLGAGQTAQFTPTFANLANQALRWTVSPQIGSISPAGLYTAPEHFVPPQSVTVTAQSLGSPSVQASTAISATQTFPVSLPQPAITNAASFKTGAVAPGEIVTLFGSGMGPSTLAAAQLDAIGNVSSVLSGTQVLFDGIAAPLVYVSARQVSAIVPYEVAGQASTQMTVIANGQSSQPIAVPVTATSPALFTADSSGAGQAAAFNQDGTLNGPKSGAAAGSVVILFGTGEGQTLPGGTDGLVANRTLPAPGANVSVTIGGINAPLLYAGAAPQEVAGVLQLNVQVPAGVNPGANAVVVTIGGASSRSDVTVTVK
jgi:uncharacterized protein (TIGR03437 family)